MKTWAKVFAFLGFLAAFGCTKKAQDNIIRVDGSSTVFPISEAVAEEFQKVHSGKVVVGVSGTGGGFKKFCDKKIAIVGASRPIGASEKVLCKKNGVNFIELPVALDGISVVVHPKNTWVKKLSIAQLKKIWEPRAQGKLTKWSQISQNWPDKEIHLFSPGVDSGTYDYFTKAIVGKAHSSRGDITSSEDDNVLVQGVATDKYGLGFFGFAYYKENKKRVKAVPIDSGAGPVMPSIETIASNAYKPLSRPIFIYVSKEGTSRKTIDQFVRFYLNESSALASEVGYVPLGGESYRLASKRFTKKVIGSVFGEAKMGTSVKEILSGS